MVAPRHRLLPPLLVAAVCAAVLAATPSAGAKAYTDVPSGHWAYAAISAVTERGPAGHKLLDDYATRFKPGKAIARSQMARALVIAAGRQGEAYTEVPIADVTPQHRYYDFIQVALKRGYLSLNAKGEFLPTRAMTAAKAEAAVVRWLTERYPGADWTLLTALRPARWEPNAGWKTGAPGYLPSVVASRQLQLRVNHPAANDGREVLPRQPINRAEVASMFHRGYALGSSWQLTGLRDFAAITFPELSARQKQVTRFALKWVGYPYVWGGEYPTRNSPYGYQASGGFDCSGFVFYVMKMRFGYPISTSERGASAMAAKAKPRITRGKLQNGDLIFFGPDGKDSKVAAIYHAGLYLGNGWFIHSTGSSNGVTLASLEHSTYWKNAFAWGRRVLTASELTVN